MLKAPTMSTDPFKKIHRSIYLSSAAEVVRVQCACCSFARCDHRVVLLACVSLRLTHTRAHTLSGACSLFFSLSLCLSFCFSLSFLSLSVSFSAFYVSSFPLLFSFLFLPFLSLSILYISLFPSSLSLPLCTPINPIQQSRPGPVGPCECHLPQNPGDPGCGYDCLNRMMYVAVWPTVVAVAIPCVFSSLFLLFCAAFRFVFLCALLFARCTLPLCYSHSLCLLLGFRYLFLRSGLCLSSVFSLRCFPCSSRIAACFFSLSLSFDP